MTMSDENMEIVPVEQKQVAWSAIESALVKNDYSKLNAEERMALLNKTCESMGLNPLGQPFGFFNLQGKEVLYAKKNCADQLGRVYGISMLDMTDKFDEKNNIFSVTVKMQDRDGRINMDRGDVFVSPALKGNDLANTYMKAVTKAKRRCILSMCGLGFLDETEVSDIPGARVVDHFKQADPQLDSRASDKDKRELFAKFNQVSKRVENLKSLMAEKFPGIDSTKITSVQCKEVSEWLSTL